MLRCRSCHHESPAGARFCAGCGLPLLAGCPGCGGELPAGARFCPACGHAASPPAAEARASATPSPAAAPLPAALGAGRYLVKRFLGEGARKRVYLARDTRLDTDVAVAVVRAEGLDADGLVRVSREARAMGRLRDHPNVVPVFDIGQDGDTPFIVSQFMDAGSVDDLLRGTERQRLPVAEAIRIAEQVASGLAHAHQLGIVHRDLKPANVWLSQDGTAKLGDFGLAVAADQSRITQEGMLVGTVAYMAPEQAMGRAIDAKGDLYALGAMLYEMLTGRPPFLGDDAVTVISQHVNTPPVAPSWHTPDVPPALDALVQQLLQKDPAKRPANAAAVIEALRRIETVSAVPAAAPEPTRAAARPGTIWGRFVGRREELEQLKEAFEDALSGRGALVMLVGEPGIGKTRLAEEFSVFARMRGAQVLVGHSYEGAVELPYSPFVEALRHYVRGRPESELRRELGAGAPEVADLVSEIRRRLPDVPRAPALEGEAERLRLFDSVTGFLQNAAAAGPLVLHLDDLHWADKPSLLLLRYLARNLAGQRLLVLGTYRDVELDRTHPLAEVLPTLRREPVFRRILLRGLPETDVLSFVSARADDEPDEATRATRKVFAAALYAETEGNPFFIGEVLSHLVDAGKLVWEGGRWTSHVSSVSELGIPEGVREVVGRRLSAVSPLCNQLLTLASAMPAGFTWEVMRGLCDADEKALLDALDEAIAAPLLRERKEERQVHYEFTHALIRQTLYEEQSAPRRVLLHRRIAERLEAIHGGAPGAGLAELAHHFFQAAPGGDVAKAVRYAVQAGERSISIAAYEEAAGHFDRALQALDLAPAQDAALRCDVLLALAAAYGPTGDAQRAQEAAGRAADLARSLGAHEKLALAALRFGGEHAPAVVRNEPRIRLVEEAIAAAKDSEPELVVRLHRRLAMEHAFGDTALSESYADRALEVARQAGQPRALAYALGAKHAALGGAARLTERLAIGSELLRVAREAGLPDLVGLAHSGRHFDLLEQGDAAGARAELEAYGALAREQRSPVALWLTTVLRGLWALLEGRFEDGERLANEALDLAQRFEATGGAPIHGIQISRVRGEQGRFEEMIPVLEALNARVPNLGWVARLAQIHAELGHEDAARREFEKLAVNDFADIPQDILWLLTVCYAAEACALLRDSRRGETLYALLLPHAERNIVVANAACNGSVSRPLGILAASLDRFEEAERFFEHAIDLDRRLGARPLLARAQCDYAQMLLARSAAGDREKALRLASQAQATAAELGMKLVVDKALALRVEAQGLRGAGTKQTVHAVANAVQERRPDLRSHAAADGTVTLVFSDMEGFTRMTESLGDLAAHRVVQEHNRVVRELTAAHGGSEVELRGDGFLLAFPSARSAALCAVALQRSFAAHNAREPAQPIRVRIGLHTGEAIREAEKFFGKTVIQAFRIADLARGEEILTSALTKELLANAGDLRFDPGREVELKGLSGPHRVYSLEWR
jgi:class 3 adenylate cyclase